MIIQFSCVAIFVTTASDAALENIICMKIFSIATESGIIPTTCGADNLHNKMLCPND